MANPEKTKKSADWERIEVEYRAGIKSLREIAAEHDITEGAIRKRAKKESWDRDLAAKIRAKAETLVRKEVVRSTVRSEGYVATEREIIDASAYAQASTLLAHSSDIKRHRQLAMKLLDEIEAETDDPELFERLGELMAKPDENGVDKLNAIYHKVISTPSRIDSMKKLSETLKNLIALERQALGLDNEDPEAGKPGKLTDEQVNAKINALLNKARSAQ